MSLDQLRVVAGIILLLLHQTASSFHAPSRTRIRSPSLVSQLRADRGILYGASPLKLFQKDDRDETEIEEEARLKILESRRYQIRPVLKTAEGVRNVRLRNGWVPELDAETGKPVKSDGKTAVTLTAFCVAAGAIVLRIGGRAALMSAVGLDFANENPELKANLEQVLYISDSMDPISKLLLFTLGWTAVKVLCFDAGGIVLAFASGILFGGVAQGTLASATAATIGSSIAFAMAKLDTPVRKKALEVVEEYPSLRGIEKVVAQDGLKAILTLRLAPILPIPIGLYNYVYGVTNVPFLDFAGGIFLGSLKPYFLDSYLGYFGKSVVEGSADGSGLQDVLLLAALGASILIGVFASQLASETWDSVLEEVEAEKKAKQAEDGDDDVEDDVTKELFGWKLPQWAVNFQISLKQAQDIVDDMIVAEYKAKVWNYTKEEGPPSELDPALQPGSPEIEQVNQGLRLGESLNIGLVLSPLLFKSFLKFADPLYSEANDEDLTDRRSSRTEERQRKILQKELQTRLDKLKTQAEARIDLIDERLREVE